MKLTDLLQGTSVSLPDSLKEAVVNDVTNDSRKVKPGTVFTAIKGFKSDGHLFIEKALASGAVAVIAESPVTGVDSSRILFNPTGDNRSLLSQISAVFFRKPWEEMKTVGITGTNGKTSTAHMLRWILEKNGIQTGIMGTVGHIAGGRFIQAVETTPDSLDVARYMREMADSGDRACVMEVSSHALVQSRVSDVRFDVTLFTNISQDHMDFHKNMNDYLEAKKTLFLLAKPGGAKIVGTYAPGWPSIAGAITFGERASDTFAIKEMESGLAGSTFIMNTGGSSSSVAVNAPGRFNIYNAAGALAAAVQLGVPVQAAIEAVSSFPGVPGRMERVDCGQKFLVAVDYAHTPDALERVLKQGALLAENQLITVFGCGGDRDSLKRPVMGRIAAENADTIVITSDNPRTENPDSIISEILAGIPEHCSPIVVQNRADAIRKAINLAQDGDVVIIAGKGHEDYQILGSGKIHFDDREQVKEALASRGYECVL
jgi:UDP-N-acetylmuramoyl-L-alanyl-D-glutamate--2,6-diaminopimelate ligase